MEGKTSFFNHLSIHNVPVGCFVLAVILVSGSLYQPTSQYPLFVIGMGFALSGIILFVLDRGLEGLTRKYVADQKVKAKQIELETTRLKAQMKNTDLTLEDKRSSRNTISEVGKTLRALR